MNKKEITGHLSEKRGLFYIILNLPDPVTGKRKPKWFATGLAVKGNKTKANQLLRETLKKAQKGELPQRMTKEDPIPPLEPLTTFRSDMLFSDYIRLWLQIKKMSIAETTYVSYERMVNHGIAPYFERMGTRLNEISAVDIQRFYAYLQITRKLSGNSILHYHSNIRKSLADVVKPYRLIPYNPAAEVERPKIENFTPNYYNAKEMDRLFRCIEKEELRLPIILAGTYGLRRSEVLGLKWDCIDFENKRFTIKHTVARFRLDGKTEMIQKDKTKNKSSFRSLPLIENVEKLLLAEKQAQEQRKEEMGDCGCQDYLEYICVDSMGA